jgi:hypothetical protein
MKVAIPFTIPITIGPGFGWKWRAQDCAHESTEFFVFYADCTADAERHGYSVQPAHAKCPVVPAPQFKWDLA